MHGGEEICHSPTRAFLIKDAWLIDGTIYKEDAVHFIRPRSNRRVFLTRIHTEIDRGAAYCTAPGSKYFGSWLMDDCVTYPLAASEGIPITTDQALSPHQVAYEGSLEMTPRRVRGAYFKELVLFDDVGQTRDKHRRFRAIHDKLLAGIPTPHPHPGVFLLRGSVGQKRILVNELEIAEYLHRERGFKIVDPVKADLQTIISACAGSKMVVGVEGSALMHGILLLATGGGILTLQPPDRFVSIYKDLAERDGQDFGFVVGVPNDDGFRIDPSEIMRTLDMFPSCQRARDLA
jgi:hypothetical protein